jgi:hypothetical protein
MDPILRMSVDQGYEIRRARHSRPRRRYQLDYLGKTTAELHIVRDFLQQHRLGLTPFEWAHGTAFDTASYLSTTPVIVSFQHTFMTGQWVGISNSSPNTALNGFWPITYLSPNTFHLNGSVAGGAGSCSVVAYLPNAVGMFAEDTMEPAVKLIGPESVSFNRGKFSWAVQIEEIF